MGAISFITEVEGISPKQAFKTAKDDALYEFGHNGYTGTISEKDSFKVIIPPEGVNTNDEIYEYVDTLLDDDDRFVDTYGPAGCIKLKTNKYLFFGWAAY